MKVVNEKRAGGITKRAERHAQQLLSLPRMQAQIAQMLADAGLSTQDIVGEIAQIATSTKEKAETRLRALDMAIRLTTGYAPTKSLNAHLHGGDKFFDKTVFSDGAAPEIDV